MNTSPYHSHLCMTRFVLYVEDQPVNVLMMKAIFKRRPDYQLVVATDGESGMEAANAVKPDLLLLDIGLPDCQGTELLERMRKIPGWSKVPAVAVTADHDFDTSGTTFSERWNKPLRVQETLDRLDRFLTESAATRLEVASARPAGLLASASV